jgi:hypothetical protein
MAAGALFVDIFRLKVNSGADGYDVKKLDYATDVTDVDDRSMRFDNCDDLQDEFTTEGTLNLSMSNYDTDSTMVAFKNALVKPPAGNAINLPDYYKVNGVKVSGTTEDQLALAIAYLELDDDLSDRHVEITFGKFDPASGGSSHKATDRIKPNYKFAGIKNEHLLTIDADLIDPEYINFAGSEIIIEAFGGFTEMFLPVTT